MPQLDGIDVSMWQGVIDWSQVVPLNLKFVCMQLGWRNDVDQRDRGIMDLDPQYRRNVEKTRAILPNAKRIHYLVPVNKPWREQLDRAMSLMGPLPAGETMMFDVEYVYVQAMGFTNMVAMHREAEQRLQRRCFWYGGGYFPSEPSWIENDSIADIPKWFAAYSSKTDMLTKHAAGVENLVLWQWGGGVQGAFIPGIWDGTARVDSNEILNLAAFNAAFGGTMAEVWLNGTNPKFPSMKAVLQAAGQVVVELPGYDYRFESRQSDGQGFPQPGPYGLVVHHTASSLASAANDHRYLALGHQYRPVSNVCLGMRNGVPTWGLVAAGASNTNGAGGPRTTSVGRVPLDQGNHYLMAIECSINGTGETWPKKMTDALIAGCAAFAKAYHFKASDVIAHGEWAPTRKIDPAGPTEDKTLGVSTGAASLWNMAPLRTRIAQAMTTGGGGQNPPPTPTPRKVNNVAYFVAADGPIPKPVFDVSSGFKVHITGSRVPELVAVFGANWSDAGVMPALPLAYLNALPDGPPKGDKGDKGDTGSTGVPPPGSTASVTFT